MNHIGAVFNGTVNGRIKRWNLMLINYLSFMYSWSSIATDPDLLLTRTVAVGVGRLGRYMKKGLEKDRLQNKTKNLRRKFELFKCAQFHDLQKLNFISFRLFSVCLHHDTLFFSISPPKTMALSPSHFCDCVFLLTVVMITSSCIFSTM